MYRDSGAPDTGLPSKSPTSSSADQSGLRTHRPAGCLAQRPPPPQECARCLETLLGLGWGCGWCPASPAPGATLGPQPKPQRRLGPGHCHAQTSVPTWDPGRGIGEGKCLDPQEAGRSPQTSRTPTPTATPHLPLQIGLERLCFVEQSDAALPSARDAHSQGRGGERRVPPTARHQLPDVGGRQ